LNSSHPLYGANASGVRRPAARSASRRSSSARASAASSGWPGVRADAAPGAGVELHQRRRQPGRAGQQPVQPVADRRGAVGRVEAHAGDAVRIGVGDAAVQGEGLEFGFHPRRLGHGVAAPGGERFGVGFDFRPQRFQRAPAQRPGRQSAARPQPGVGGGRVFAAQAGLEHRPLQRLPGHAASGREQRLDVAGGCMDFCQPQAQPLAQEALRRRLQEPAQRLERQARVALGVGGGRERRTGEPGRKRRAPPLRPRRRGPPLLPVGKAPRVAPAERRRRERLQRVAHHQRAGRLGVVEVLVGGGLDQFADQYRGFAHAAVARVGAQVAQVEHVLGRGEQLQEQEAVVLAQRAVAAAAAIGAQFGGEPAQAGGGIAPRVVAVVEPQHADDPERQQPHRHHAARS
jgi:hypothetical protein